jgi:MFS superfamily sulfate permease-like transporter
MVTIVATLLTDLLMGVFIGMLTEYAVCAAMGVPLRELFRSVAFGNSKTPADQASIRMPIGCIFGNVIGFKSVLDEAKEAPITLDFSETKYVDHTFMLELRRAEREHQVMIVGLDRLVPLSEHKEAARRSSDNSRRVVIATC